MFLWVVAFFFVSVRGYTKTRAKGDFSKSLWYMNLGSAAAPRSSKKKETPSALIAKQGFYGGFLGQSQALVTVIIIDSPNLVTVCIRSWDVEERPPRL